MCLCGWVCSHTPVLQVAGQTPTAAGGLLLSVCCLCCVAMVTLTAREEAASYGSVVFCVACVSFCWHPNRVLCLAPVPAASCACACCCAQADGTVAEGFEGIGELMPPGLFDNGRPGRGEMALGWEELSGKLALVARLLAVLRQTCDDK